MFGRKHEAKRFLSVENISKAAAARKERGGCYSRQNLAKVNGARSAAIVSYLCIQI